MTPKFFTFYWYLFVFIHAKACQQQGKATCFVFNESLTKRRNNSISLTKNHAFTWFFVATDYVCIGFTY